MEYENPRGSGQENKGGSPHRDAQENVNFFYKQMGRVNWLPDPQNCPVSFEVQEVSRDYVFDATVNRYVSADKIKEHKCVVFMFPKGNEKMTTVISFHQPCRKAHPDPGFKDELCAALNFFGSQGWLEHKLRNADGSPKGGAGERKVEEGNWDKLFKRY